ncbi:hypothetical protein A1Q2_02543 [Trichosporon asahii var. asahii CBS 8904]|uniref:F-box domain-containing protein n=1 Tax=Trichosporon asahii var. asahii (strain CBS 8904) TaxID=1220162 RepID=K1WPU8_TRIAC|nr:hypothetical protein A1Q2_02543 [Trichosporon asahii var. asahii CBS 8904]
MPSIDWLSFPHILDEIFDQADSSALACLRTVCRHFKAEAERRLYRHVTVAATYPGVPEVQFISSNDLNIPGLHGLLDLTPGLRAVTLQRLEQHTRILDICRHPFDIDHAPADLTQCLWWMKTLKLDLVRVASPRSLWVPYLEWGASYWGHRSYADFATYPVHLDTRIVPPPPAQKAVFFIDLTPPYPPLGTGGVSRIQPLPFNAVRYKACPESGPRLLLPPDEVPYRQRYFRYDFAIHGDIFKCGNDGSCMRNHDGSRATTLVLNLRYEPNHPLLPAARWFVKSGRSSEPITQRIGPRHLVIIFSPTPYPDADEAFSWARQAPLIEINWEGALRLWRNGHRDADYGMLMHLWELAWPVFEEYQFDGGGEVTFVGLEDFRNVDLGLPTHIDDWPARKAELELRYLELNTVRRERCALMPLPDSYAPNFLMRDEYRAIVGEEVWEMETSEPLGAWSEPPHHQ